jgi:predicted anti-sigma-YlaC factor YlaD
VTLESKCREASDFESGSADVDSQWVLNHIAGCPECTDLLDAHRKLAHTLQREPRNSPSFHFDRKLRNRLREEQQYKRTAKLRLIAMQAYWSLATIASLIIIWLIPWSIPSISTPVLLSISIFVALTLIVPAMFYRGLKIGMPR